MSMKDFARTVIRMSADTMKKEEANFYASDMGWLNASDILPLYGPEFAMLIPITTANYLIGNDEVAITLDSIKITKIYISASAYVFIWANVEQHDNTAGTGLATETVHTDGFIQTAEIPIRNGWKFDYGESIKVTISNTRAYGSSSLEFRPFGYTAGGYASTTYTAATERYDDVADTWTARTGLNTARYGLAGFSFSEYGYTAGGSGTTGNTAATEKYDDMTNLWTAKNPLNTARRYLTGFSLSGYGYAVGGLTTVNTAITEKYDDVANLWTVKANLIMYRYNSAGFSLNGYGYVAGGYAFDITSSTEKYDAIANTWTAKTGLNTARYGLAGFSLNGYGYTAGGDTTGGGATTAATEKYDDVANTWTAKANLNTARLDTSGFSFNGYGYTAGGNINGIDITAATEKYDDAANTWTAKTALNTARDTLAGFSDLISEPADFWLFPEGHRYAVTLLGTAKPNMEDLRAKLEARGVTI